MSATDDLIAMVKEVEGLSSLIAATDRLEEKAKYEVLVARTVYRQTGYGSPDGKIKAFLEAAIDSAEPLHIDKAKAARDAALLKMADRVDIIRASLVATSVAAAIELSGASLTLRRRAGPAK